MLTELFDKWKKFVNDMNAKGVPMPTIRDPKTGLGSISLTLVFVSSLLVIAGIVGKWSGVLGGIDMSNAMQFLWTSVSLYWGRKFQSKTGSFSGDDAPMAPSATAPAPIAKPAPAPAPSAKPAADDPDAQ